MKKTLSVLAVLGMIACCAQSVQAFSWSNLNPANWGHCPRCERPKNDCGCQKKCDPCGNYTGAAAPCDPCAKKEIKKCDPCQKVTPCQPCQKHREICEPCEQLQNMNK